MDYLKSVSGLLLLLLCTSILPARTWTSSDGKTFEGDFVELTGDNQVVINGTSDGKTYTVPMDRFSGTDQSYVKAQIEAAKQAAKEATEDKPKATGKLKKLRDWTSATGEKKKAKFVRMNEGKVVLLIGRNAGEVPFSQFSKEDQEFLRVELEAIGKGDELLKVGKGGGDGYGDGAGGYGDCAYGDCGADSYPEGDMPEDYSCDPTYDCGDMPDGEAYEVPMYGDGAEGGSDDYESYDCGACGEDYESYDCGACGDDYESYDCGACGEDYESYDCGACGDDYESYDCGGGDVAYNSPGTKKPTKRKESGASSPSIDEEQVENGEVGSGAPIAAFAFGGVVIVVLGVGVSFLIKSKSAKSK